MPLNAIVLPAPCAAFGHGPANAGGGAFVFGLPCGLELKQVGAPAPAASRGSKA